MAHQGLTREFLLLLITILHMGAEYGLLPSTTSQPLPPRPQNEMICSCASQTGSWCWERLVSDHTLHPVAISPCTFLSSETRLKRVETTSVFVTCCRVTNDPKALQLKATIKIYYPTWFLWARIFGTVFMEIGAWVVQFSDI